PAQLVSPVPDGQSAQPFADRLRRAVPDLAAGALAIDLAGQSEFGSLIGREGRLVRVEVSAPKVDEADRWADSARRLLGPLRTLADVRDAYSGTQPTVEVSLERQRIAQYGLSVDAVANALAGGLGGVASGEFRETDRRTPITVRFAGNANEDLATALATPVRGIPVGQLVSVQEIRAPLEVVRINARERGRASAMAAITAGTGVLPLMCGWGGGGALYKPLAAGVIGGSVTALLVTFFLLPTAYAWMERRKDAGKTQ